MRQAYRIMRAFLMTVVILAIVVPTVLYVALSLPSVQNLIKKRCEHELTQLLGADVSIGDLGIKPFNRATLRNVAVVCDNDTLMKARRIGAGINLYEFLAHGKITVNYAELLGIDARLARDSADAPLNIMPVIEALAGRNGNSRSKFRLRINTVVVRQSTVSYDVLSEPETPGRFNRDHMRISDLRADINVPMIKNDDFTVNLKRLAFTEQSGFEIKNVKGNFHLDARSLAWSDVEVALPSSSIVLGDGMLPLDGPASLPEAVRNRGVKLDIEPSSRLYMPDLAAFCPDLSRIDRVFNLSVNSEFSLDNILIDKLNVDEQLGDLSLSADGISIISPAKTDSMSVIVTRFRASVNRNILSSLPDRWLRMPGNRRMPATASIEGDINAGQSAGHMNAQISVADGEASLVAAYNRRSKESPVKATVDFSSKSIDLAGLLDNPDLGKLNADAQADLTIGATGVSGSATLSVKDFTLRRYTYDTAEISGTFGNGSYESEISLYDKNVNIEASAAGSYRKGKENISAHADIFGLNPYALNLTDRYEGYDLSCRVDADIDGLPLDRSDGSFRLSDMTFSATDLPSLDIKEIEILNSSQSIPRQMEIRSDFLNGTIEGDYSMRSIVADIRRIVSKTFPSLTAQDPRRSDTENGANRFHFNFTLNETEPYREFLRLPVSAIYPVTVQGVFNSDDDYAQLSVDAPFLRQNNKLIENTSLVAMLDGRSDSDNLYLTTQIPTKHGPMALIFDAAASADHVDSDLRWKIDRQRRYEGSVSLSSDFYRDEDNRLISKIAVNQSELIFNDSVWVIHPAEITATANRVVVDDINVSRRNQFVKIDGIASSDPDDLLTIDVLNLNLDYIFESIGIDKVMLGGDATGTITASSLLTAAPHIVTDGIDVTDISYNKCVLGDAVVKSRWDMETKAVVIDGTIKQPNDGTSKIEGEIFALNDSLDIRLYADRVNVGFMETYMSAFASDISGIGSGNARLWGSFKDIDMEGDLYVDDLRLKLNFTNTYFLASDSIHISPGTIRLDDITIKDPQGHTARLDGIVHHSFFREPVFRFTISDARNMLVYDESSRHNPDWYGKIYANGGAKVTGDPKTVKIDVDVSTAPGSMFTFVLSELEEADEYTFITFRDKGKLALESGKIEEDIRMGTVNRLRELLARQEEETSADYVIELRVAITPDAEIDLVMDPVAGDRIRSHGSGNLRMVYTSADNDLRMFGTYTLDKGLYNFTLQDIIIKDFTITEGSSISFTGDPLVARLDIRAIYSLNANLSDLDESFLQDKDLNRTNVPVHAVLKVTGDIQQPEIGFDIEFPTLNQDTYRKVRSIVSTEEMMNRQIIYLLALNRFYTPDYMASTTKGNELVSVASSTLSSQLSNILGQLSDNWAIAPNLRSDRGDFSDVEVDVALSSRLLNNRLLLNGNFGYRDKSLNSNQFIGDFDLEYLLNRPGTIRLKAYNHYNDQNYYVRTATTTQGVGVMFKRDFDNIFSFLRRMRRKSHAEAAAPADREKTVGDSVE